MAKKKTTRKPTKKAAKKPARKAGASSSAPAFPGNPTRVTTGKGASPEEIGKQVVAAFNKGQYQINTKLWSPSVVCIEGGGLAYRGLKNVQAKNAYWNAANLILGASAEGPYVGSTGFAIKFKMDVEDKSSGRRTIMEEIGVYSVQDGKVEREEYMYGTALPAEAAMPQVLSKI